MNSNCFYFKKGILLNSNTEVTDKNESYPTFGENLISLNYSFNEERENKENYLYDLNSYYIEKEDSSVLLKNNDMHQLYFGNFSENQDEIHKKVFFDNKDILSFKINRNYFINNLFDNNNSLEMFFEKTNSINNNFLINNSDLNDNICIKSNLSIRCDTLLIKFKSVLGKWFILNLNNRIKNALKRKIKFFSFNYKKFTIVVNYSKNKTWLDEKIKHLLILGEEPNQVKNMKALKSLYKKKVDKLNDIKDTLEQTYRIIIKQFYLSEEFINFKKDKRVIELNDNFIKTMNVSILENNGFITFLETRKGNIRKK